MTPTDPAHFVQSDEYIINDLDTLKVIADPLRLQIIEIIFDHSHTVKQVASKLDTPVSKLYYHINLLEKHGLIRIASTRVVSGIVEKSYQASARKFRVQNGLLNPAQSEVPQSGMALLVDAILEDAKQDIKHHASSGLIDLSGQTDAMRLSISRTMTRLTPHEAVEFQQRLKALTDEFQAKKADGANADEQSYALVFALYPTTRGTRPAPDEGDVLAEADVEAQNEEAGQ